MRHKLPISIILASVLALGFTTVDAQQGQGSGDRDQQMDRDYDREAPLDSTIVEVGIKRLALLIMG